MTSKRTFLGAAGILSVVALLGTAQATPTTYSPTSGAPWVSGASSFDWTDWSYADNILANNASVNRTWTVPFWTFQGINPVAISMSAVMANSGFGTTTGQLVTNFEAGGRFSSLAPVAATSTVLTNYSLGTGTTPLNGTAYANFVVGKLNGRLGRITYNH